MAVASAEVMNLSEQIAFASYDTTPSIDVDEWKTKLEKALREEEEEERRKSQPTYFASAEDDVGEEARTEWDSDRAAADTAYDTFATDAARRNSRNSSIR